jgi:hypothetical protein
LRFVFFIVYFLFVLSFAVAQKWKYSSRIFGDRCLFFHHILRILVFLLI